MSSISNPTEASIHKRILAKLNALPHCYAHKVHGGPYGGGQPDIDGAIVGLPLKIEVKRPGGKATELQQQVLDRWERAGALAFVAHSWEEVERALVIAAQFSDDLHDELADAGWTLP